MKSPSLFKTDRVLSTRVHIPALWLFQAMGSQQFFVL
jgi:hypothetical protein